MLVTRVGVDNDTDLVAHGEDRWGQTLAVAGALADLDVDLDVEHGSKVAQHDRETPVDRSKAGDGRWRRTVSWAAIFRNSLSWLLARSSG